MIEPTQDQRVETPPEVNKTFREEVVEHITGQPTRKLFGTFGGVFTPTLLTGPREKRRNQRRSLRHPFQHDRGK